MADTITWLQALIVQNHSMQYLIVLLGTMFGGEIALFLFGFFLADKLLPFFPSIFIAFIGAFAPNILWYALGRTKTVEKTALHKYANTTFTIITEAVYRISRGSHLVALVIIKFLFGTPVLMILYMNRAVISVREFVYYQTLAIIFSMVTIVPIGYFSGRGFFYLAEASQNLYTSFGFILLVIFMIIIFQIWLERKFTNTKK